MLKRSLAVGRMGRLMKRSSRLPSNVQLQICRHSSVSSFPLPAVDLDFLLDPANSDSIISNIVNRKGIGNLDQVHQLYTKWTNESDPVRKEQVYFDLISQAAEIPNISHPHSPIGEEDRAITVDVVGQPREFDFKPRGVVDLGESLGYLRCYNTTVSTGPRTYYFLDSFAKLESALIRFTLSKGIERGFTLVSVPDLVDAVVIEAAGFKTTGERTQVYRTDDNLCLAGSAEMSLVGYLAKQRMNLNDLPLKLISYSRCYRAETSNINEESGIYRVHQFTKVELFGVTIPEESQDFFQELVDLQREIYSSLGLHFRILNMPTQELGASAYCKYDFEAWMPHKGFWGEVTSTSNCTDFQSRRIHLTYENEQGNTDYCHTVNGTGCAVPRTIMAIVEHYQNNDGTITIPQVLRPYMNGEKLITMSKRLPRPRWIKSKKH